MFLHEAYCVLLFLKSLLPGTDPWSQAEVQPGPVSAVREREGCSRPGSTYVSSPLPAHASAFLFYTTSFFPALIVCLPTLPGLLKQNAGISSLLHSQSHSFYFYTKVIWNWLTGGLCTPFTLDATLCTLGRSDSYQLLKNPNAIKKQWRQNIAVPPQAEEDTFETHSSQSVTGSASGIWNENE